MGAQTTEGTGPGSAVDIIPQFNNDQVKPVNIVGDVGGDIDLENLPAGQVIGSLGVITLRSANGGLSSNNNGYDLNIIAGDGLASGDADGGNVEIYAGAGNDSGEGGDVLIYAGQSGASGGTSGDVSINAGDSESDDGDGGSVDIFSGSASVNGMNAGDITITAGSINNSAAPDSNAGDVRIQAGYGNTQGVGGDISIVSGASDSGTSGSIFLTVGNIGSSGDKGTIRLNGVVLFLPFANAAARDVALTPSAGMMAYLSDTNVVTVYVGTSWRTLQYAP